MGASDARWRRSACWGGLRAAISLALVAGLTLVPGRAVEVDGFVELTGAKSDQTTEVTSSFSRELHTSSFFQRYSVNANWLLYPHLRVALGGLFERDDALTDDSVNDVDVTQETLRPYLNLSMGADIFSVDLGFYRLQDRFKVDDVTAKEIRDTWNATMNWRPVGLPLWRLYLVRNDLHDANRESLDTIDTLVDLSMEWAPVESFDMRYRGGRQRNEDRIQDVDFGLISHSLRLTYGDSFWKRRLLVSAEYNGGYQKRDLSSESGGEAVVPVFPAAGISINDDFPATVTLAANPALTDGNRTTSAGINLGLPPPGGDDSLRNIGLDFTVPLTVDMLRVSVDQTLPTDVASSFVWEVYSSANNQDWVLMGVASATFSQLDSRFELRFGDVTARYVKVVTAPLDLTDPSADQFPFILVTEVEAFDRTPVEGAVALPGLTTHRLTTNARVKLLPAENFYYDFSYFGVRGDLQPTTYSVSNALSYNRQLNRLLGLSTRVAREDGRDGQGHFISYPYTASLRAGWLPTLRQSLVLSGVRTDFEESSTAFDSLFLQTSAELYRGISFELGLGHSRRTTDGDRVKADQLTAQMYFLPHRTLTMTLLYQLRRSNQTGAVAVEGTSAHFNAEEFTLSYRPFPAIYLYGSYRVEEQEGQPNRTLYDYNLSWNPFPSGSLEITLRYDETYRSTLDTSSTISSATVRWNLRKGRWLEGGYVLQKLQTSVDRREFETVQANLRWTF